MEKNSYPEVPKKYRTEHIGYSENRKKDRKNLSIVLTLCKYLGLFFVMVIVSLFIFGEEDKTTNLPQLPQPNTIENKIAELPPLPQPKIVKPELPQLPQPNVIKNETVKFPQLSQPKVVEFNWEYAGSQYATEETLYESVYGYYSSNLEKDCWSEEDNTKICLQRFSEGTEEDKMIPTIALEIKTLSLEEGLSNDELLELVLAFVQSIPYDYDKAEIIESMPKFYYDISEVRPSYPRYPYEVLYDNEGVCTGKTFLAVSLIKELGYGVAIFNYEAKTEDGVGHMAPAVKCPVEHSSYNSGFCYIEVTNSGFKIGDIPTRDIDTKMPQAKVVIGLLGEADEFVSNSLDLGEVEIYEIADGNSYQKIIETTIVHKRVEAIEVEFNRLDGIISASEQNIKELEASVQYQDEQATLAYKEYEILGHENLYDKYMQLFSQYELTYTEYSSKLNEYEEERVKYNNLVAEYNLLIEEFY